MSPLILFVGIALIWLVVSIWIFFGIEAVYGLGAYASCFSDLNDYFVERLKHDNDTEYIIIFPCPEKQSLLNQTFEKDESNK